MNALVTIVVVAALSAPNSPDAAPSSAPTSRQSVGVLPDGDGPALLGLGIALDAPRVGVMIGAGGKSRSGSGYTLGAGLLIEPTSKLMVRLSFDAMQGYAGRATLRYLESGERVSRSVFSDFRAQMLRLGVGVIERDFWNALAPYAGIGGGIGFAGYAYHFNQELEVLEPLDLEDARDAQFHFAAGWVYTTDAWVGMRMWLASWLSAQLEVVATHMWLGRREVPNTKPGREVVSPAERLYLVQTAFSLRVLF